MNNNQIIEKILSNEKIIRYKKLEEIINKNRQLARKMNELKDIQKKIVLSKKLSKDESLKKLEQDYELLLNEINDFPLMSEYMDLQEEINYFLQNLKSEIELSINSDLSKD